MISQEEDNSCFEGCPGFANKHGGMSILESYRADRNIKDQLIILAPGEEKHVEHAAAGG